jgi:starch phosphorylase
MVSDYVNNLYAPAARAAKSLNGTYAGARELATWKSRVRAAWSDAQVDHVESAGVGDAPELGSTLEIRAFVSLGRLDPADVDVQVVHGRVDETDQITGSTIVSLRHAEAYEGGRHRYAGEIKLERTGAFGYTTRIVPHHRLLASPAELGVAALPSPTGGMDSGDLR